MTKKHLLIVGGSGNLGKAIISSFKENWNIVNIDMIKNE